MTRQEAILPAAAFNEEHSVTPPKPAAQVKAAQACIPAPASDNEAQIVAEHVNLFYGAHQALKDVNLEIHAKEITAIIGPSGCGKSSFLRCLNRMNDVVGTARVEGRITVGETDVYARGVDVVELRRRVGMVFQRPNPFPSSIYDNVAYGPRIHGIRQRAVLDQIVERSLQSAALWDEVKDRLRKSAVSLSGGQQQRLCIARCLAVDPEVILLDEPCSALDPISTYHVEELLLAFKDKYTIVLVTHNLFQAARVADTTCFFLTGELVETDRTARIFENPKDERTEDFVRGRFG